MTDLSDPGTETCEVFCELAFAVEDGVDLALQVAVAHTAGTILDERLDLHLDGHALTDVEEIAVEHGGRIHSLRSGPGQLTVAYRARVQLASPHDVHAGAAESIIALRQSRYCPSDQLQGLADAEVGLLPRGEARGRAVADWVFERLTYELGSSGPFDTAVDTLLAGRGVCRDFAHLTVALCRAIGVPARIVSAYAPGLSPMDFHAVAEVAPEGVWEVVDATKLAPRSSLVRIGTGRDASDTAFATTLAGSAELLGCWVSAVVDGDLPLDDHAGPARVP